MGGFSHMPGEDPAEKLYELAQHQFEYERYDMAAAYARRALQSVADAELGERLRELLRRAEAADAALARAQGRASLSQRPEQHDRSRWRRRQSESEDETPARSMLDDDDTDIGDDAPAAPQPAAQRPSILTPSAHQRPVPPPPPAAASRPRTTAPPSVPTPAASPRAGSCMHCGYPLPDRSISVCPGCGQDPLVDVEMGEESGIAGGRRTRNEAHVPDGSLRARCCPKCSAALPQPLPRFCQNCGARLTGAANGPSPVTQEAGPAAPRAAPQRLLFGWLAFAAALVLIVGYTSTIRATDAQLQRSYPPSIRGANAPHIPPPQTAARGADTPAQGGAPQNWMPERQTQPDQQIHTRTRLGWWRGDRSWRTPTFKAGNLWAICWVTAEAGSPFAKLDVSIHSADGSFWRPAVYALGTDQGVEYCRVSGTFYLEIDADEPWVIEVWDLN